MRLLVLSSIALLALGGCDENNPAEVVDANDTAPDTASEQIEAGSDAESVEALRETVAEQAQQIEELKRQQDLLALQARLPGVTAADIEASKEEAKRRRELDDPTVFATDPPRGIRFGSSLN